MHGEIKRGTKIICYLKEDQSEFLEDAAILGRSRDIVRFGTLEGTIQLG